MKTQFGADEEKSQQFLSNQAKEQIEKSMTEMTGDTQTDEAKLNQEIMNYVVLNDVLDSFLDYRHLYEELVESNPNIWFILVNLPGQPFTQTSRKSTLNNAFHSDILDQFFFYLHEESLIDFTTQPFSFIAYGSGGATALHYSLKVMDTNEALKSILLFNSYSYVDNVL